ncbi:hypothetical protein [Pinibacter soli]|uniref:Uncharacterized protein n=1 Tax=Pinibacter soli TaxID=3044211 RepID=A0ABT6RK81_9BACT|nr:hypothetical protein [Pinibacter soli]MDI3322304.1 hypothetical protein [Pinibacter soli]
MNTKFPLLIAAGLLLTVATTQAQNNSKKYAANYPAHNSAATKSSDRPFHKNEGKSHKQPGKHHHHHGHGHHK